MEKSEAYQATNEIKATAIEIPKHLNDTDRTFLDDLLLWSPNLPANCRKPGKVEMK